MSNRPSGRGGLDLGLFSKSNRPSRRGGLDIGLSKRANPGRRGGVVQSDARITAAQVAGRRPAATTEHSATGRSARRYGENNEKSGPRRTRKIPRRTNFAGAPYGAPILYSSAFQEKDKRKTKKRTTAMTTKPRQHKDDVSDEDADKTNTRVWSSPIAA